MFRIGDLVVRIQSNAYAEWTHTRLGQLWRAIEVTPTCLGIEGLEYSSSNPGGWDTHSFRLATQEEIETKKNFKKGDLIATELGKLYIWPGDSCLGVAKSYRHATREEYLADMKETSRLGAADEEQSSFELLHGKKKPVQKPQITKEQDPPPAGWDNCSQGYCQGDWLIRQRAGNWYLQHHEVAITNAFSTPYRAAEFKEKWLCS